MHNLGVVKEQRAIRKAIPLTHSYTRARRTALHQAYRQSATKECWSLSRWKRVLDFVIAVLVLLAFAVPMLVIAILIRLSSKGPAIFVQERVGQMGRRFVIYKFRSMEVHKGSRRGPNLTKDGDDRITPLGRWLRKFKLDELPQFYNVLRGDMSLVGPRPKLQQYAELACLQFRPGITGAATIAFRSEEEILRQVHPRHLDRFYLHRIKPLKERIDLRYMNQASLWSDLGLVIKTFGVAFIPARIPGGFRNLKSYEVMPPRVIQMTGTLGSSSEIFTNSDPEFAAAD